MNNYFQVTGGNRNQFNALAPPGTVPQFIPATDFETGFFSIFTAGNFGSDIAFWVDDDISVCGENGAGGLGDGYLKFVNVGRFLHLPKDALTFRVGQFELDLPFTQARTINISPYDIYSEANIGAINSLAGQQNVANQFTFARVAKGIELSGGHQYGGYHYSLAVIDQNTTGVAQGDKPAPTFRPPRLERTAASVSDPTRATRTSTRVSLTALIWSATRRAGMTFRLQGPRARTITPI